MSLKSVTNSIQKTQCTLSKGHKSIFINYQTIKLYEIVPHHSEKKKHKINTISNDASRCEQSDKGSALNETYFVEIIDELHRWLLQIHHAQCIAHKYGKNNLCLDQKWYCASAVAGDGQL